MDVILFDKLWYHQLIAQVQDSFSADTSADAAAIAQSIMIAGSCISQSLDHLSETLEKTNEAIESYGD